ncbi:hypothetical protein ACQ4PT_048429 [Festuca glaucescens]
MGRWAEKPLPLCGCCCCYLQLNPSQNPNPPPPSPPPPLLQANAPANPNFSCPALALPSSPPQAPTLHAGIRLPSSPFLPLSVIMHSNTANRMRLKLGVKKSLSSSGDTSSAAEQRGGSSSTAEQHGDSSSNAEEGTSVSSQSADQKAKKGKKGKRGKKVKEGKDSEAQSKEVILPAEEQFRDCSIPEDKGDNFSAVDIATGVQKAQLDGNEEIIPSADEVGPEGGATANKKDGSMHGETVDPYSESFAKPTHSAMLSEGGLVQQQQIVKHSKEQRQQQELDISTQAKSAEVDNAQKKDGSMLAEHSGNINAETDAVEEANPSIESVAKPTYASMLSKGDLVQQSKQLVKQQQIVKHSKEQQQIVKHSKEQQQQQELDISTQSKSAEVDNAQKKDGSMLAEHSGNINAETDAVEEANPSIESVAKPTYAAMLSKGDLVQQSKQLVKQSEEQQRQQQMRQTMVRDAMKAKDEEKRKRDSQLAKLFEEFLPRCIHPNQVKEMVKNGSYILEVNFVDLLKERKLMDLVIKIAENPNHPWLNATAGSFLHHNGMSHEDINILKLKASVSFVDVPERFLAMKNLLQSGELWRKNRAGHSPLTKLGRRPFIALIDAVLKKHEQGLSYDGKFDLEDLIMIGLNCCLIYAEPQTDAPASSYVADFNRIWEIQEPFYRMGEDERGFVYPLNMHELKDTLLCVRTSEVETPEYSLKARYHPTLAPSKARQVFIVEFRREVKGDRYLQEHGFLSYRPCGSWKTWRSERTSRTHDWREDFHTSLCAVLSGVFKFDPKVHAAAPKAQVSRKAPSAQVPTPAVQSIKGQAAPSAQVTTAVQSNKGQAAPIVQSDNRQTCNGFKRFKPTVWGMVNYDRCLVEHGKEHGEGPGGNDDEGHQGRFIVENHSSVEVHAFARVKGLFFFLLSQILDGGLYLSPRFAPIWVTYTALFDTDNLDDFE